MGGPSRSVRFSSSKACEGPLAIGPKNRETPFGPGRRETATVEAHRAIEAIRRRKTLERKHEEIGRVGQAEEGVNLDTAIDEEVGDDLLGLIFTACHPVLS